MACKLKVNFDHVTITQGMTQFHDFNAGRISTGSDYSYIHIKGIDDKLAITPEVVLEYSKISNKQSPFLDTQLLLILMNIALRHKQYIDYKEVTKENRVMKTIEVWMEGFVIQGNSGTAELEGTFKAESFDDAVKQWLETKDKKEVDRYYSNNHDRHSWWGCELYDNEQDARKAFG